jgi:hypothetical protein
MEKLPLFPVQRLVAGPARLNCYVHLLESNAVRLPPKNSTVLQMGRCWKCSITRNRSASIW